MTSTINFTDLNQKIALLKELHQKFQAWDGNMEQRERYVALRREVSTKLLPLFGDLADMNMLMLWTEKPVVDNHNTSTLDNLEVSVENSGIQMRVKGEWGDFD